MIGLSTAWIADTIRDEERWFGILEEVGAQCIELEYRIPARFFAIVRHRLKGKHVHVLSIHNFFPFPEGLGHLKPSGDLFFLSSADKEERQQAVKFTIKTIEVAAELDCSAVVLHLGKVSMESYFQEFCHFFDAKQIGSAAMEGFLAHVRSERQAKRQPFFDAVCFSLDTIIREAERRNVRLGLENRYYFHEIPTCEELEILLELFSGAPVFHWHDVGHGFVQEQLGIQSHEEWFNRFGDRLLGVHLHDASGCKDHQALQTGKVDFGWLKPHIVKAPLKILELHPEATPKQVRESFALLREMGLDAGDKHELCS